MTSLCATAVEHLAAALFSHALTKPMSVLTVAPAGLISTFHKKLHCRISISPEDIDGYRIKINLRPQAAPKLFTVFSYLGAQLCAQRHLERYLCLTRIEYFTAWHRGPHAGCSWKGDGQTLCHSSCEEREELSFHPPCRPSCFIG